ncbi:MAG: hypothetical protein M0R46_04790 [Candidatus Muirbacterium halophilum]|nr:hypothetical protein [Candidatus Muirbacterium halophilum]MCK9475213.1 hypothetical protein [Candidatus Muirbacterium halophilum]
MGIILCITHIVQYLIHVVSGDISILSLKTIENLGFFNSLIAYCKKDFSLKGCLYSENLTFFIIILVIFIIGFFMLRIGERDKKNENQEK